MPSSTRLPQEVTVGPHMLASSQIQWACYKKWNGKPRLECVNGRHPPSKTPVGVLPWTCRKEGKCLSRYIGVRSNPHKWFASRKIWSVEKLETLPEGTKPRTSSITWMKEEALDDLLWKDEGITPSVGRTLELFQSQRWEKLWETWAFLSAWIPSWTELNKKNIFIKLQQIFDDYHG